MEFTDPDDREEIFADDHAVPLRFVSLLIRRDLISARRWIPHTTLVRAQICLLNSVSSLRAIFSAGDQRSGMGSR